MSDPIHSDLGGSGAERWMHCPGSVALLKHLGMLEQSDEPDYRRDGIGAHEAAAHCLKNELDAWEIVGQQFYDGAVVCDDEMAKHLQVYLNAVREHRTPSATMYVEAPIGGVPERRPHPKFYGTVDCALYDTNVLDVTDFKYGEGIVVEPYWNPQMMYYAYGILLTRPTVREDRIVRLRIAQPRAFHAEGPVREWETTAGEVMHWGETELLPAMNRTELDNTLDCGEWCRFCPAKLVCPLLTSLFGAAAKADPSNIPNLNDEMLGRSGQLTAAVKFYIKAMEEEQFNRMNKGRSLLGLKLVQKQSKRVFPENIQVKQEDGTLAAVSCKEEMTKRFGKDAFETDIKSPAELEKLSDAAKAFVKEYAYFPNTGLTVALETDKRPAVKVETAQQAFGAAAAALQN